MNIHLKRAYAPADPKDGLRVLVERLWPRGLTKAKAHVDLWLKDIAPTTQLRQWFGHDPARWKEFQQRYRAELHRRPELLAQLAERARRSPITVIDAARDEEHNGAMVLLRMLKERIDEAP